MSSHSANDITVACEPPAADPSSPLAAYASKMARSEPPYRSSTILRARAGHEWPHVIYEHRQRLGQVVRHSRLHVASGGHADEPIKPLGTNERVLRVQLGRGFALPRDVDGDEKLLQMLVLADAALLRELAHVDPLEVPVERHGEDIFVGAYCA
eukprot:238918-Prymnesium_polylepis.1